MKKKTIGLFAVLLGTCINVSAQETFKVMFYNLLNYPNEDAVPNRIDDLDLILSDYQPDLFLVCELNNITGANDVLNITKTAISTSFEMASYVSNTSDDNSGNSNELQNLLYYDTSKFTLEEEVIVPTDLRDFNIYRLQLKTVDQATNPIDLYVVVSHLKASTGVVNENRRFNMILNLENYLDTLPADANVILGGDLNVYSASEPAFQELIDDINHITFVDPPNRIGAWNNNPNFVDVFTQSTRTQSNLGGAGGGMDSRFDFLLTSENMIGMSTINYVTDSFQAYGNNGFGACYNSAINSSNCGNASSTYSFAIRDALHDFSDHLPVTLSLEANVTLSIDQESLLSQNLSLDKTVIDEELTINYSSEYFGITLKIHDQLGKHISTTYLNDYHKHTINTTELVNGIYFISIQGKKNENLKFIVKH
ncbi:MAG: hypothetical protein Wins2KO_09780 [Winogradskyella sp.]